MKYRVLVFSPAYNVIRRMTVEADDEFTAVEVVMFQLSEMNREDPDAVYWVKEITE